MNIFDRLWPWLLALIVVGIIVAHYHQQSEFRKEMKAAKQQREAQSAMFDEINRQLNLKHADDCVLESTSYGFSCREIRTGRLFKIKL